MRRGAFVAVLVLVLVLPVAAVLAEDGPFDFYWTIFQPHTPWPIFPDLWLFAPEGEAVVTIRDHTFFDSSTSSPDRGAYTYDFSVSYETTIVVPSCTFVRFPLEALRTASAQMDWGFWYVEVRSDKDVWVVGEKRKTDGGIVPDPGTARPYRRHIRHFQMGANWSHVGDDRIVVVAPTAATVTMDAWGGPYGGWDANRQRTYQIRGPVVLDPYYVFDLGGTWTLRIDAETPVALAVMEAGGFWRWDILGVDGYNPDWVVSSGRDTAATAYILDRDATFAAARMEGGGTLRVLAPDGTELFRDDLPETKGKAWGSSAGTSLDSAVFPTGPQKVVGTAPFALDAVAPTPEEGTTDSATFFGFDPASSRLLVWNEEATPVTIDVYDARRPSSTARYVVAARSASSRLVRDLGLGLADSRPFLLAVRADRPTFMSVQVRGQGGFLRPYPFRFAETCPEDVSESVPCIEIKVPPAGRKVSGTCLAVMADVCHETGSPVEARRAIASVLFEYRIGGGAWTTIPPALAGFPNPDTDRPWLVHWDVSGLPEETVAVRAVATDRSGSTRTSAPVEVRIDHAAWEVRTICGGRSGAPVEARVRAGAPTEATAEAAGGESTVRVVLPAGVAPAGDVVVAEVVEPSDARVRPFPAEIAFVGEVREVRLESGRRSLDGHADLYLSYADSDADGVVDGTEIRAEDLRGYWLSDTGLWYPVETLGADTVAREVRLRTDHFTLFGLGGPALGGFSAGTCLVEGLGLPPRLLAPLRISRDRWLSTALGRLLALWYYAL